MQAQPARPLPAPSSPDDPTRLKLIAGFSVALVEKGYAQTTIADVARQARVSKRTFYEHFEDKEACFLATYRLASDEVLKAIAGAAAAALPWKARLLAATHAYLGALEIQPELTRTFLLEIHAGGPRALALRREVHQRFADLLRRLVQAARKEHPELRPLSPAMATAVVGGINELVLVALEPGRQSPSALLETGATRKLHELAGTAAELVQAVLAAPAD